MSSPQNVFEDHAGEYDRWFDEHRDTYEAEIRALREAVPCAGRGLDLGAGSGRFAEPLGICCGIDPSRGLSKMAQQRGSGWWWVWVSSCRTVRAASITC